MILKYYKDKENGYWLRILHTYGRILINLFNLTFSRTPVSQKMERYNITLSNIEFIRVAAYEVLLKKTLEPTPISVMYH